jgi:hypothetical protein
MATQSTENIQLKGPEDWEAWSTEFKTRAIAANIWRLINPRPGQRHTDPLREEPIAPQLSDYEKKPATARENRAHTAQSSGTMQDQPPQPPPEEEDELNKPKSTAELTTGARQLLQLDMNYYQQELKAYNKEQESIEKLKTWVGRTTTDHLRRTCCNPEGTLKSWYTKLKEQVGISDGKLLLDARAQYRAAIKHLSKAPKDPLAWLDTWEQAISQAKEKNVPEAQLTLTWFEDLSNAIRGFMKEWIVSYELLHATEIDNGTLTFRKLANDLRRELTKSQTPRLGRVVAKGAFGPSFADPDETEQPKEDEQGKKKSKSKRKLTAGESSAKCPACELQGHTLANCLYIFPEKAKGTFRGRKGRQEEVNKRLEEDNQLQKEVDRLRGKKQKEGEVISSDQD